MVWFFLLPVWCCMVVCLGWVVSRLLTDIRNQWSYHHFVKEFGDKTLTDVLISHRNAIQDLQRLSSSSK